MKQTLGFILFFGAVIFGINACEEEERCYDPDRATLQPCDATDTNYVCGCNDSTYINACMAERHGVIIVSNNRCKE